MDDFVFLGNTLKILLIILILFCLLLSWKNKRKIGYIPLFTLSLFTLLYLLFNIFINYNIYSTKILELYLRPIGIGIVISCLHLVIEYTGHKLNKKETLYILYSYFLLSIFLFGTNFQNMIYEGFEVGTDGYLIPIETNLFFLIYILPTSVLVISSVFIIYKYALQYKISRNQSTIIGTGLIIGYLSISIESVIYTFHQAIDIDAIGIGIGVLIISFAIIKFDYVNNIPILNYQILNNIDYTIISVTSSKIVSDIKCNNAGLNINNKNIGNDIEKIFNKYDINILDIIENEKEELIKIMNSNKMTYYNIKAHKVEKNINMFFDKKELIGYIIVISDVTDEKKNEEQIKLLKNIFGRVLRHNIRNELNIIRGNTNIIQNKCSSDEESTQIEYIDNSISELLRISKKAQKSEKIIDNIDNIVKYNSNNVVEKSINYINNNYLNVEIKYEIESSFNFCAHEEFMYIIKEIIDNGIEHNDSTNKKINIKTTINKNKKQIIIKDNGNGIPEHELKPILHSQETPLEHCSSLGLWIIKFVIDISESSIEFKKIKNGTKIIITIH